MTVEFSQPLMNQAMIEGLLSIFGVLGVQAWPQEQLQTSLQLTFQFVSTTQLSDSLIQAVIVAFH